MSVVTSQPRAWGWLGQNKRRHEQIIRNLFGHNVGSVFRADWFGAIRVSSLANIAYAIYTRGDIEQYFPGHPASSLR